MKVKSLVFSCKQNQKKKKKEKVGAIDQYTLNKLQYCVWESAVKKTNK